MTARSEEQQEKAAQGCTAQGHMRVQCIDAMHPAYLDAWAAASPVAISTTGSTLAWPSATRASAPDTASVSMCALTHGACLPSRKMPPQHEAQTLALQAGQMYLNFVLKPGFIKHSSMWQHGIESLIFSGFGTADRSGFGMARGLLCASCANPRLFCQTLKNIWGFFVSKTLAVHREHEHSVLDQSRAEQTPYAGAQHRAVEMASHTPVWGAMHVPPIALITSQLPHPWRVTSFSRVAWRPNQTSSEPVPGHSLARPGQALA